MCFILDRTVSQLEEWIICEDKERLRVTELIMKLEVVCEALGKQKQS